MRPLISIAALVIAFSPSPSLGDFSLALNNIVVSGNLTANNEVEGRTYVGGNLTNGSQYAIHEASTSADTLTVGGNVAGGTVTLNTGNFRYGGTLGGNVNLNGGSTKAHDSSIAGIGPTVSNYLNSVSQGFSSMASTNTMASPAYSIAGGSGLGDQNGTLTFNILAGSNGTAVIDIDASLFNSSTYKGHGFEYNVVNTGYTLKEIVFNVTGTTADLNINSGFGNSFKNSSLASDTIFNFSQATNITLEGNFNYFYGALLAPMATYTNNADNQGSVYVQNFIQNSEVHLASNDNSSNTQGFAGLVPAAAAVPEPATALSCLTGLGMFGLAALRRRRALAG